MKRNQPLYEIQARCAALALTAAIMAHGLSAFGQEALPTAATQADKEPEQLPAVVVTATREPEFIAAVPTSVTIIDQEQLAAQSRLTPDLAQILGKLVPGMATANQSKSTFGQTLRGRNIQVLIDGVPQSTTRNAQQDLATIHPSAVERIEVIRGTTAVYGDGATGGIINIVTKRGRPNQPLFQTDLKAQTSATRLEGLGGGLAQSISGEKRGFDYFFSGAYERTPQFFDAEGDRIPPDPHGQGGVSELNIINLFGKVGHDFGLQRLELSTLFYNAEQDTDYTTDPSVNAAPFGAEKARAIYGLELEEAQEAQNFQVNLDYTHEDLLRSRAHGQLYFRDYFTRFFPFDARNFPAFGSSIIQSRVDSEKFGGRWEMNTPIFVPRVESPELLWGVDLNREETSQPVGIMDPVAFANSGGLVYRKVGERPWVPVIEQYNLGAFGQLEWQALERLTLRGGVRYENIWASADDFVTLAGGRVSGGSLHYDATLFNAGLVYEITDPISAFFNFSQGFSIADIGRTLRGAAPGSSVEALNPEAQKVENFEVGLRGEWERVQTSLAGFYNHSDLGTTFDANLNILRAPERVYGVELTLDTQPIDQWGLGGTASWIEGENDPDNDGVFTPLDNTRIPPWKLTAYLENQTLPQWRNRLQAVYSGERDRFSAPFSFGRYPVDDFVTFDFISTLEWGVGTLQLGVENLLNAQYYPPASQVFGSNSTRSAARGTVITAAYSVRF